MLHRPEPATVLSPGRDPATRRSRLLVLAAIAACYGLLQYVLTRRVALG
jgi:hypothetical protein